jgi:ribosomal-protein-alanine N-acetyltransferase
MRPLLISSRLRLTAFTPPDAVELHELLADPHTYTIGSGPFHAVEQTENWIANRVLAQRDHGLCWYALRDQTRGLLIGTCGMLKGRTSYAEPEIGYLIRASHRGQGYATEAASAVVQECRIAGLTRVWATIRPANTSSRRIAERLGMRVDHIDTDQRGDLLYYVLGLPEFPVDEDE